MELIAVAVGAGIVLAALTGGSVGRILDTKVRWFPALLTAVAVQLVLGLWHPGDGWPAGTAVGLYVGSFSLLGVFCVANLHLTGMPVVLLGVVANFVVVLANGAMPVRLPSDATPADRAALEESATHEPEAENARLTYLGQIVPLPGPTARTVSFGDLVLAVGLVDLLFRASRRPRARRRRGGASAAVAGDHADPDAGESSREDAAPAPASDPDRDGFDAADHTLERVEHLGVVDVPGR